jgi:hypothetical protein
MVLCYGYRRLNFQQSDSLAVSRLCAGAMTVWFPCKACAVLHNGMGEPFSASDASASTMVYFVSCETPITHETAQPASLRLSVLPRGALRQCC